MISGWCCAVCGASVEVATPFPWRCPRSSATDRRHVLHLVGEGDGDGDDDRADDPNPFVRWGPRLAWWAFARARGLGDDDCVALTREVADDFAVTPYGRSARLSQEVGGPPGEPAGDVFVPELALFVKDETGNVAGSHKARHLVTILLHLRAAEELGLLPQRPPLAIASCGNAALAAATLARRVGWPIEVYVPEWMDDAIGVQLDALGAAITRCPRRADDPPGDPSVHRFREAVAAGAVPFSVQGPENALCLDGGRTLGWEIAEQSAAEPLDRIFVQVGGGAFAACVGGVLAPAVRLHPVQTEGCAPFARAWERARSAAVDDPAGHWAELMTPWEAPASAADGILDDETYDWLGVWRATAASGGSPVVVPEAQVTAAHTLARRAGFAASATGSAGLAGVLTRRAELAAGERVGVVMSGVER